MKDDRSHLGRDAEHFERYRAPEPDFSRWAVFAILVLAGMWLGVGFLQLIGVL